MRHVLLSLLASRRLCWLVPAGIGVALLALLATPARSQYPYHPYARPALQQQMQHQQMLQTLRRQQYLRQQWQLRQQALHASASRTVPSRPATKSPPAKPFASGTVQPALVAKTKSAPLAALTQPKSLKTHPAANWRPNARWASSSWSRTETVTYTPFGNVYGQWSSRSLSTLGGTSSYVSTSNWVTYGGPLGFDAGVTVTRTIVSPWGGYTTQVYSVDLQTLQQIALSRAIGTSVLWLGIMNNNVDANEG